MKKYSVLVPREFWEAFVVDANTLEEAIEKVLNGIGSPEEDWNDYGDQNIDSNSWRVFEIK